MSARCPPLRRVARARRARLVAACLLAGLACAPLAARAQGAGAATGTVGGQVFDRETGDPVEGVSVVLLWPEPTDGSPPDQRVQVTDANGAFRFEGVPAGTYSLTFVKTGYRAAKMTSFEVQADRLNRADFPIQPTPPETADTILDLEAFVVEAEVVEDILDELELRMDADQLLNIMSAEDFSKFAASDVADALKRVSGVNVVDGQFAIIRGLEDRYSATLYNRAPVPSPDPNSQSVQLDLFPADIVSNLIVAKTFAPDQPSNSSGGSIDIVTHEYPEGFQLKLSGGTGFNDNAVPRFLDFVSRSSVGEEADGSDVVESDYGITLGGRREVFGREVRFKGLYSQEVDYETREGVSEKREPDDLETIDLGEPGCQNGQFVPGVGFVCLDPDETLVIPADLTQGKLTLSGGRFELTESSREEQRTGYLGVGFDLDRAGDHRIDASGFYTRKSQQAVELKENGFLPGFDFSDPGFDPFDVDGNADFDGFATLSAWITRSLRSDLGDNPANGPAFFANFSESEAFDRERDLRVYQVNGDHRLDALVEGLRIRWAANQAETSQDEAFFGTRFFVEPPDPAAALVTDPTAFPVEAEDLLGDGPRCPETGPMGQPVAPRNCFIANNGIFFSANAIEETQDFVRIDADLDTEVFRWLDFEMSGGAWYERAEREVGSAFLESAAAGGASNQFAIPGATPQELGRRIFADCEDGDCLDRNVDDDFQFTRQATNESSREIRAWHFGGKATLWERVDLMAGFRREHIVIESLNDPFQVDPETGAPETRFGVDAVFPNRFLFFDRLDNPANAGEVAANQVPEAGFVFNDEILGIEVPASVPCPTTDRPDRTCVDLDRAAVESLVNGRIDEKRILPAYGFSIRPMEGLNLRGAYSRTVARPSFREMGYYVSVEPGTDDRVIGNPQLRLSDVESWDARAEYAWGDLGDLVALSVFKKSIQEPIESIVIRDPLNAEGSNAALFRTFFNNPNEASLRGFEVEGRKNLGFFTLDFLRRFDVDPPGFLRSLEFLKYLSVGGNFTWIDAEVDRTEAELARSESFFRAEAGEPVRFSGLEETRRLFNQPEWIANADISFDHPDWGTRMTLAFFQISDVLDAAGTATIAPNGDVISFTLDRYVDSFHQLDLVLSQKRRIDLLRGDVTFKLSAKNLTDSTRRLVYDPDQTVGTIAERTFNVGRDYSFSISYEISF